MADEVVVTTNRDGNYSIFSDLWKTVTDLGSEYFKFQTQKEIVKSGYQPGTFYTAYGPEQYGPPFPGYQQQYTAEPNYLPWLIGAGLAVGLIIALK